MNEWQDEVGNNRPKIDRSPKKNSMDVMCDSSNISVIIPIVIFHQAISYLDILP